MPKNNKVEEKKKSTGFQANSWENFSYKKISFNNF